MQHKCDRCSTILTSSKMSWFNKDVICPSCQEEEKEHPLYQKAKDKEQEQVRKGNYNYEGLFADLSWNEIKKQTI